MLLPPLTSFCGHSIRVLGGPSSHIYHNNHGICVWGDAGEFVRIFSRKTINKKWAGKALSKRAGGASLRWSSTSLLRFGTISSLSFFVSHSYTHTNTQTLSLSPLLSSSRFLISLVFSLFLLPLSLSLPPFHLSPFLALALTPSLSISRSRSPSL